MKFTLSWLRTHLDTEASLTRIAETLNAIGLEVEGIENRAVGMEPFLIAEILDARPHPDADRLRVCEVSAGGAPMQVVCGAPNARAGLRTVFAPPGSVIPASGAAIKVGRIRGVESQGMLCSWRELGLPCDENDPGIAELPSEAPIGEGFARWRGLDDPVIEIAVTPNRGDALAVRGVARDLAAAGLGRLREMPATKVAGRFPSPLSWRVEWPDACPWILGRAFRGLRNGPSPEWLRERLLSIGLRPVNALVDITNFFAVDLGRPLHVFDRARLRGDILHVRRGAGERFQPLHGSAIIMTGEDCLIADEAGAQSLAGVIGGADSGCDEATTEAFLECALFDPILVAKAGRRHGVNSDARSRFERGVDQALPPVALEMATRMILDLCGGEASEPTQAGAEPGWRRGATLRFSRLRDLGGSDIPPDDAAGALARLGFAERGRDPTRITVAVPSWRNDIAGRNEDAFPVDLAAEKRSALRDAVAAIEPECDLLEEVLRLRGLDAVAAVDLPPAVRSAPDAATGRAALARRVLAARGLLECVMFSFVSREQAEAFGGGDPALRLLNPIAADLDQMRPTPLAGLAARAGGNAARGAAAVNLFEIGPGFADAAGAAMAAGLRLGHTPRHPLSPTRAMDAADAQSDALALLSALGVAAEGLAVTADAPPHYHPGRSGRLMQGKRELARFGMLHPGLLARLNLPGPVAAFEVHLNDLPDPKARRRPAPELPPLQAVRRDFAFLLPAATPAAALLRAVRGADRHVVTGATVFDVYVGPPVPEGWTSVGVEVILQPRERSFTDMELDGLCARIAEAAAKAGARLR